MTKKTHSGYTRAIVKFNSTVGALLCNGCKVIITEGFDHKDVEHYCPECQRKRENDKPE